MSHVAPAPQSGEQESSKSEEQPSSPSKEALRKLDRERNLWIATVRANGRPHLVPVWFVWSAGCIYLAVDPESVKARNLRANAHVALALEDGSHPVICEGVANVLQAAPAPVAEAFHAKYDWAVAEEREYSTIVEIVPSKWMVW